MKIRQRVMTIVGAGVIAEIRHMKDEIIYLVEIKPGGLGRGYSDVFTIDEIEEIEDGV